MKNIHILSDEVASQIAAGEVIERPSSVVKELVENSIDAGASQIDIRIKEAGKSLIEVVDNGKGIGFDDLEMVVLRHATSKLQFAKDLFNIKTLGFRGEAIASIASVSHFQLISKSVDDETGGKIENLDGKSFVKTRIGWSGGTSVSVRNLFYNVPARLKFLKSDTTERQHITTYVTKLALAYPHIRFLLVNEDQILLQTNGNGDRREILTHLFGLEMAKQMLEVKFDETPYLISGYISPVALTRSNRKEMSFFVNGRWIQDVALSSALMKAYHTMIMVGRYPISVLFLELPSDFVDVNVHPTKAEVRFEKPDLVFSLVQRATRRALLAYSSFPEITPKFWSHHPADIGQFDKSDWIPAQMLDENDNQGGFFKHTSQMLTEEQSATTPYVPLLRHVGQVGATYIVAEGPDGLYLIDQHAAHERILFEKWMAQIGSSIPSQQLLAPEIIKLPAHQAISFNPQLDILRRMGFDISEFGPNTYQIRAIPAMLIGINPQEIIKVVVEDFEDDELPLGNVVEAIIAARICKRAAIKGGQVLSREEQKVLIENLEKCESPRTCPHGRPTMIHLSVDVLEKQFGRRGSL